MAPRSSSSRDTHHGGGGATSTAAAAREAHRSLLSSIFGPAIIPGLFGPAVIPGTQPFKPRTHQHHNNHDHHHPDHHYHRHKHDHHHGKTGHPAAEAPEPRHAKAKQPQPASHGHKHSRPHHQPNTPASSSLPAEHRRSTPTTKTRTKAKPTPRQKEEPPKRVKLTLKPLDSNSISWVLNVPTSLIASKLRYQIRQLYRDKCIRLPMTVSIQLFDSNAQKLGPDHKLFSSSSSSSSSITIWYRIIDHDSPSSVAKWRFSCQDKIDKSFAVEMSKAIEAGATVGEIRKMVAGKKGVQDVNRVRIYAEDGMRRGALMGNDWVLKEIGQGWLCRWLSLDVRAEGRYVVLKGMKRREGYLFHPSSSGRDQMKGKEWCVKWLKAYLERDVFFIVGSKGEKGLRKRIALRFDGQMAGDEERVKWGGTYELELPVEDAELFNEEEARLLLSGEGSGETCVVCGDEKKVSGFPVRVTEGCKHDVTICKECLEKWLESSAEAGNWRRLRCPDPECEEVLEYASVKRYASGETFGRYDRWMLNDSLEGVEGFERCLASGCGYGHIHDPACEVFQCRNSKCGKRHCIKHHIVHENETCTEYERRQERREEENKKSEKVVSEMAKECPKCKRMVHKTQGCNHITCTCRHEWCYICFAPFMTTPTTGILLCHHNPGCTEAPQPFAHLFDREGNLLNPGAQDLQNAHVLPPPPPFLGRQRHIIPGMRRHTGPPPHLPVDDAPEPLRRFVPQPLVGRTALGTRRAQRQGRGSQAGLPRMEV
ncbi:hypothetical protein QBC44DRAFT_251972 [Cladorrhinum sp. PSN332]|nr:hypothetical protein QBC44DRAFT_251972 [Cladorrhinum sp. PSN332]